MNNLKQYWKNIPAPVRKPLVLIIGSVIVFVGLALLLLPGPGWLVIFLGFALLATEFAFAEKVRDWLVDKVQLILKKTKKIWNKVKRKAR